MLRIALLGCGEHSTRFHATALERQARERAGQVQLVAAVDLDLAKAQKVCRNYGFQKAYTDYRPMLAEEKPDAVVAIMPVAVSAAVGEDLLRRGIPCVLEKPLGANIEQARRLVEVAKQTGTRHMVSVNRRFLPLLNRAKKWVAEQGPVRFFHATMLRTQRLEADFVWETGLHLVDSVRYMAGEIADLHLQTSGGNGANPCVWYAAALHFASGAQGAWEILTTTGVAEESYDLHGEGFRARLSTQQNGPAALQCWQDGKLVVDEASAVNDPPFVVRGELAETGEFLDALLAHRHPRPSLAEVLPSAEICQRMLRREGIDSLRH